MQTIRVLTICNHTEELTHWRSRLQPLKVSIDGLSAQEVLTVPTSTMGYDLIVIDTGVIDTEHPHSTITLCRMLRPLHNGAMLLLLSSPREAELLAGYAAGADDCLAKPVGDQLLQVIINSWCNRILLIGEATRGPVKIPQSSSTPYHPALSARLTRLRRNFLTRPIPRSRRGFDRRG